MQIQDKGTGRVYVSAGAIEGRKGASSYVGVPVTYFEAATFYLLGGQMDLGDNIGQGRNTAHRLRQVAILDPAGVVGCCRARGNQAAGRALVQSVSTPRTGSENGATGTLDSLTSVLSTQTIG